MHTFKLVCAQTGSKGRKIKKIKSKRQSISNDLFADFENKELGKYF
jgi:hypothetical protein